MRKINLNYLAYLIAIIFVVLSSPSAYASAKDGEATVYEGSTTTISISSAYQSTLRRATGISYKWYSENTNYVTVSSSDKNSAVVRGVKATPNYSPCRVYYQCSYYIDGFYRTMDFYYEVTVKASTVYVTSISLNKNSATMTEGDNLYLSATVYPYNATNKSVRWSSSDTYVASVSSDGYVTAKNAGSATIKCEATDGSGCYDRCYITVTSKTVYVSSVSLNSSSITLDEGSSYQLSATISPSNATNKSVTWSSNNTSVATVSSNGYVTAKGKGTATITCKASDGSGKYATCSVTVNEKTVTVTDITLNKTSLTLNVGETYQLQATVTPSNATNKNVTWSTSNSSVATVSNTGNVTAKGKGTVSITCKASDGSGKTATCSVTVNENNIPSTSGLEGTYHVKADVYVTDDITLDYPEEFDMVIEKSSNGYIMTSLLGFDLQEWNREDLKLIEISNGKFIIQNISDYVLTYNPDTELLYSIYIPGQSDDVDFEDDWHISVDSNGKLIVEQFFVACFEYDYDTEQWWGEVEALYIPTECKKIGEPIISSDYRLFAEEISSRPGASITLPVSLSNLNEVSGLQFNLSLPNGVTVSDAEMTSRASSHTPVYNFSEGVYKFSILSLTGKNITGKDGVIMNIELEIDKTVAEGVYPIILKNILVFTANDEISVADQKSSLTIKSYKLGDVNGNGEVNTNDAIAIVNYVIGKSQAVFIKEAADVNGNGEINTNDAIAIVNYVIGKSNLAMGKRNADLQQTILFDRLKKDRIINNKNLTK